LRPAAERLRLLHLHPIWGGAFIEDLLMNGPPSVRRVVLQSPSASRRTDRRAIAVAAVRLRLTSPSSASQPAVRLFSCCPAVCVMRRRVWHPYLDIFGSPTRDALCNRCCRRFGLTGRGTRIPSPRRPSFAAATFFSGLERALHDRSLRARLHRDNASAAPDCRGRTFMNHRTRPVPGRSTRRVTGPQPSRLMFPCAAWRHQGSGLIPAWGAMIGSASCRRLTSVDDLVGFCSHTLSIDGSYPSPAIVVTDGSERL